MSKSSALEEAFFWFLVFLLIFAGRASTSEVSPFFVLFLVFLRIEEATGTSASDGWAVGLALGGMMSYNSMNLRKAWCRRWNVGFEQAEGG